jgi:uncharacterized protein
MLYTIGTLVMDTPMGLNPQEVSEEFGGDFAVKPVVGAMQPREFVGPADTRLTLMGTIFPFRFVAAGGSSGLNEIETLRTMAASGEPYNVVRGDGVNLGPYLIERVSIGQRNLGKQGIGREQQFSIAMVKSPKGPSKPSLLNVFQGIISSIEQLIQ